MRKSIILALSLVTAVSAANITYNVISLANGTRTMGVIVDNLVYPLLASEKASLLYTGSAPIAIQGYSYTILEGDNFIYPENFTRAPVDSDTVNEYYNRSWNKWELDKLPVILPPLPIINRIESNLHIDGQIPTIHFTGNQTALDLMHANQTSEDIEVPVNMTYISLDKVKNIDGITLQLSGHSTRTLKKLSYKISIPKKQDIFGYRKIKLRSMGTDPSYMKEFLAYDMYNSVGLPATKFSYVRLYMNDEPIGLFGLTENYKNPWIRNEFANGDKGYKQGTLYVGDANGGKSVGAGATNDSADLSYLGNNVSLYSQGYYSVKEDPSKGKANFTRIMDLTKFISDASNTTTDNSVVPFWEEKMDVDSFLRGMAMEILISNIDGYFVLANNYLLYDDLENERLLFSASDFDLTMGLVFDNGTISGNYTEYPNFSQRSITKMLNVPKFKSEFENLLVNITQDLLNNETLTPRIEQVYQMLITDVEWDKSLPKKGRSYIEKLIRGGGSDNASSNPLDDLNPAGLELKDLFTNGIPFDSAVNGPSNLSIILPLKEWVNLRSKNILTYFNQIK